MIIQLIKQTRRFGFWDLNGEYIPGEGYNIYFFGVKETGQKISPPEPMSKCPRKLWGRSFIEAFQTNQSIEINDATKIICEYEV